MDFLDSGGTTSVYNPGRHRQIESKTLMELMIHPILE